MPPTSAAAFTAAAAAAAAAAHQRAQEVSLSDSPDASPVSDDNIDFGDQVTAAV
jgi:hypothetical protein